MMVTPYEINVGGRNCLGKWTYEIQGVQRFPIMWLAMYNIIVHEVIRNLHANIAIKDMQIQITLSKGSNKKLTSYIAKTYLYGEIYYCQIPKLISEFY